MRKSHWCPKEAAALRAWGCDSLALLVFLLMRRGGHLSLSVAWCLSSRLPTVKTVYCMSEAELVDVALGLLIEVKSYAFLS